MKIVNLLRHMRTVAEKVEEIVAKTSYLEDYLGRGLINCSALARQIQPQVENELKKNVSEAAILMSLKRLSSRLEKKATARDDTLKQIRDLTVRSGLSEFTFLRSDNIVNNIKQLLDELRGKSGLLFTFTQGTLETTIIINSQLSSWVENIFKEEKLISRLDNVSAIVIKLPSSAYQSAGIYYSIIKQLAWSNISINHLISTRNELTVILVHEQIDRAFSVLINFFSGLE